MRSYRNDIGVRLLKIFNVLLIPFPIMVVWFKYYNARTSEPFYFWGNCVLVALYVLLYFYLGKTYDAFMISHNRISETAISQALAVTIADVALYLVTVLLYKRIPNPLPLLAAFAVQLSLAVLWSWFANLAYYHLFPAKRTIIVYETRRGMKEIIKEYRMERKFKVIKSIPVTECLDDISVLDDMEVVFLSGVHSHDRNVILKYCIYNDKMVYMIPRIGDVIMSSAQQVHLFHLPMMRTGRYRPSPEYVFVKRAFDIFTSALALIVLSPVFLVTAIAIKATDKGPVFYKQERLTKDGKRFMIHKFRSMRVDAEKDGVARLSTGSNDDRITPVGRFIRKCRIDELPQLIDILAGNLSVVGPRPERPEIAEEYMKEMPEFQLRLQAKAGLTGYAQVYGKYNTTPYDKLQMDLMYIAHPSFAEDIRICFATIRILFTPESTEGIAQGQTTAMGYDEADDDAERSSEGRS